MPGCAETLKLAASDVGVRLITCVPGYPITELAETAKAQIAVNEKVALEMALGASATGTRSLVMVKCLGMNLLADPLVASASHTIGSGLVVLVGDDLGPRGSQVEMDSRYYGPLADLPVLDPRDPQSLYHSLLEAYALSEEISTPVIVRLSSGVIFKANRSGGAVGSVLDEERARVRPLGPQKGHLATFDRSIWDYTARGRHQLLHRDRLFRAKAASESTSLNLYRAALDSGTNVDRAGAEEGNAKETGIIATGFPAALALELDASLLAVGYAHPLPMDRIRKFLDDHERVLVAEEPEPFLESQLQMSPKVYGRLTGHLPVGSLDLEDLKTALEKLCRSGEERPQTYDLQTAEDKGFREVCDDCPFLPVFQALGRLDVPVAGDVGCTIRAVRYPFEAVDIAYGLGSSIGVASGFKRRGVAVIGDYALAHSGLQGLVNALWKNRDVTVVLIRNRVAAMTGGQDVPDLMRVLEALVPLRQVALPASKEDVAEVLSQELAKEGVSVVVADGWCPRYDKAPVGDI